MSSVAFQVKDELAKLHALLRAEVIDEDDEDQIQALLEGETDIVELASSILEAINEDKGLVEGAKAAMDRLKARKERFEQRIERNKDLLFQIAAKSNHSVQTPVGTFGQQKLTSVEIEDESAIPDKYKTTKLVTTIDKRAIASGLRDGETIKGAKLTHGKTLFIKV